jgi:hypothetical protein
MICSSSAVAPSRSIFGECRKNHCSFSFSAVVLMLAACAVGNAAQAVTSAIAATGSETPANASTVKSSTTKTNPDREEADSLVQPKTDAIEPGAPNSGGSKFLFVPYPITEPALGSGLLAGLVWMRSGPENESGPKKPQAYGVGSLWTDGGSRGVVAFDHRTWGDSGWRTTAVAMRVDLDLSYPGLSPEQDQARGFILHAEGGGVEGERRLGDTPNSLIVRAFSATATLNFHQSLPPELGFEPKHAQITGIGLGWARDTRDDVFTPASGHAESVALTIYPQALGASFDAQSLSMKWTSYFSGLGPGVLGVRTKLDLSYGNPPFYLRPYISFRGVAALRYPGEQVASIESEYRLPINSRWDVLAFGGVGSARADILGVRGQKSVGAGGVGIRFKVQKLFGLTFGLDFARGPEGDVTYIQIGNAWGK